MTPEEIKVLNDATIELWRTSPHKLVDNLCEFLTERSAELGQRRSFPATITGSFLTIGGCNVDMDELSTYTGGDIRQLIADKVLAKASGCGKAAVGSEDVRSADRQFENVLACLNTAVKDDPGAVQKLCEYRVSVTQKLADHPHVISCGSATEPVAGMLGFINGVLLAAGLPRIAASYEGKPPKLVGFKQYTAQCVAPDA